MKGRSHRRGKWLILHRQLPNLQDKVSNKKFCFLTRYHVNPLYPRLCLRRQRPAHGIVERYSKRSVDQARQEGKACVARNNIFYATVLLEIEGFYLLRSLTPADGKDES